MSLKFPAGFLPLLVLLVSAWFMSKPVQVASLPAAPEVAPVAKLLEAKDLEAYVPFDIEQTFVLPAGPKGLEYSAGARDLDGKKVRITGSMVGHLHDDAAVFLLTPQPMILNMAEYGLADDLPPNAVHVIMPVLPGMAPDFIPHKLVVYGRLELGNRQELDNRISQIRLFAEHITAGDGLTLLEPRRSVLLQPARVKSGKVNGKTLSAIKPE